MNDIVIVSAFGRGHWMASELAHRKHKVHLVDVSPSLGRWTPEDAEGPFGFFHHEALDPTQLERLLAEDTSEEIIDGFCLWLKSGPLELKNILTSHWLKNLNIDPLVQKYLAEYLKLRPDERRDLLRRIKSLHFENNWLAHFAHQFAAPVFKPNAQAMDFGRPLPLMAPYFLRRVTRQGTEKSLEWCRSKGVQVHHPAEIKDLRMERGQIAAVEIQGDWSGVLQSRQFVWALTSEETEIFGERLLRPLFPRGAIKPLWCWVRFEFKIGAPAMLSQLPAKTVVIEDIGLPWTHTNLLCLERKASAALFDGWIRIPAKQRFQREYLENLMQEMIQNLGRRLPGATVEKNEMPLEYQYDSRQLGPSRWPVYGDQQITADEFLRAKNLTFFSPETWDSLDWSGRFEKQNQIVQHLDASVRESRLRDERRGHLPPPEAQA